MNLSTRFPWRSLTVFVFGAALLVQGYLSFSTWPEPYPSIRMPGFTGAASKDGTFSVVFARAEVQDVDGTVHPVSVTELMQDFRFSVARPSYDYLFESSEAPQITPSVKAWLRSRLVDMNNISNPAEMRMCWQRADIDISNASVLQEGPCIWRVIQL